MIHDIIKATFGIDCKSEEFEIKGLPLYMLKPKILLGLTATPERMDGASILDYKYKAQRRL